VCEALCQGLGSAGNKSKSQLHRKKMVKEQGRKTQAHCRWWLSAMMKLKQGDKTE
jgi:hypothetical protein